MKCYFLQRKVRSVIFYRTKENNFIPVAIVKKESKKGKNITKDNYEDLFDGEIHRVEQELMAGDYIVEEL